MSLASINGGAVGFVQRVLSDLALIEELAATKSTRRRKAIKQELARLTFGE